MERLTYNSGKQWEINGSGGMPCDDVCDNRGLAGCGGCPIQKAFDRLAAYEDTGLEPEEIDSVFINSVIEENKMLKHELEQIAHPPNDPLTLEDLREMDGEPVWIVRLGDDSYIDSKWAFVNRENCLCRTSDGCVAFFELYGKAWLAYRRKPEEGTTCLK